jgi:HSP20 family protein
MALNNISATFHFAKRPHGHGGSGSEAVWTPNTDVYLVEGGLVIKVELAGMRREDLDLTVEGNQLRISGVRHDTCREGQCKFVLMEINYGPFESVIDLPPGYDPANAKAAYQNGFLRVDVPLQSAATRPFSVPIDADGF